MLALGIYSSLLGVAALLGLVLARYTWHQRPAPGAGPLTALMVAVSIWAAAYMLELIGMTLPTKIFWAKVQYLGIVTIPLAWLVFALHYTRRDAWLASRRWLLLGLIPTFTLILAWTNEIHGWLWAATALESHGPFPVLGLEHGGWFAVYVAYSYGLLLAGSVLLVFARQASQLYRHQLWAILIGAFAPWVGNGLYIFKLTFIDLTPVAFTLSGLALTWGLFRQGLLKIMPLARAVVVEGLNDGILVVDAGEHLVDANPAALRMLGQTSSNNLIGLPIEQALGCCPTLLQGYSHNASTPTEFVLGHGAEARHYELTRTPLYDARHRPTGQLLLLHDITERKRAEAQQVAHQQYIEQLNRITQISIETADFQTVLQKLADQLGSLFGADGCFIALWDSVHQRILPGAAYGPMRDTYAQMVVAPNEITMTQSVLVAERVLVAEDAYHTPYMHARLPALFGIQSLMGLPLIADGHKLGAALIAFNQPHTFSSEEIARGEQTARQIALFLAKAKLLDAVQRELAERKVAEQVVQERNDQLNALFDAFPDLIIRLRQDGTFVDYHLPPTLVSTPPEFLLGRSLAESLPPASAVIFTQLLQQTFGASTPQTAELVLPVGETVRYYEARLAQSGRDEVICILRDITERKYAEQAIQALNADLQRSNADLEQFAYVASHDLQEPLRMITSYTQLLIKRYQSHLDTDAQDYLQFAADGAKRMSTLIKALLEYSRVGRNTELGRASVAEAVQAAMQNLHLTLIDSGGQVTTDSLPDVQGNTILLTQLFQNLMGNALKFCPAERPPHIHVGAVLQDTSLGAREWVVYVQDNGIGIAPQDFQRLFQIFQRLHTRAEYPGTGIGLAVCKKIVERHGGRIWLESQLGQGTTFYFTLQGL